jgi:membrane protein
MNDCPIEAKTPAHPPKSWYELLKATLKKWSADSASRLSAAFSYYAIFSIGPLLIIAITLVGFIFGHKAAEDQVRPQITSFVGDKAAGFIQELIKKVAFSPTMSFAGIISIVLILYAATNLFVALQQSLNIIFGVRPRPGRGLREMIRDRAFSILMVFAVGAFILASVIITTLITALTKNLSVGNPTATALLLQGANFLVSALIFTGAFALMFKYLPDIKIDWKDTLIGAAFTAVLFALARIGLGYYLARSSTAGPFGAAGSLVIVMLFIYYSAQIFFFGAEFTQVYACRSGKPVLPSDNAEAVPSAIPDEPKSKKRDREKSARKVPAILQQTGADGGHWESAAGGGWNWVLDRQGRVARTKSPQPIGKRHPPMRFGPQASPARAAGVAALMVLPVAWFYWHAGGRQKA